jgi:tryptophan-rich sensory protein
MSSPQVASVRNLSPIRTATAASVQPVSSRGMSAYNMKEQLGRPELWLYIVIAIILIVVLLYVANDYKCVFEDLKMCSWTSNYIVGAIIMVVGVLLLAYASFTAQVNSGDQHCRYAVISLFGAICVLLVIAFTLFFRNGDFSGAFYVALVILFLAVLHMYFSWKAKHGAGWVSLVFVIVSVLFVWFTWDVTSQNNNREMKRSKHHKH